MIRQICKAICEIFFRCARPWLVRRYPVRFEERTGLIAPLPVTQKKQKNLWIHAVSVGEVTAAYPFVLAARRSGYDGGIFLSTTTPTGQNTARKLLGGLVDRYIYYPFDAPSYINRALDVINPWAYCVFETELWPNLLYILKERHIPAYIVNGRLSPRSLNAMTKNTIYKNFWADVAKDVTLCMAKDDEEAARYAALGMKNIEVTGDCKVDALLERKAAAVGLKSAKNIKNVLDYEVFIAGSTHEGEEKIVLEAFSVLKKQACGKKIKLVIAPRHPQRAAACAQLAAAYGYEASLGTSFGDLNHDVLIVDKVGTLFELYGASSAAFIGGSLVNKGGQNLMEPAVWGIPVTHGPYMEDFKQISAQMDALGLSQTVRGAEELVQSWLASLLANQLASQLASQLDAPLRPVNDDAFFKFFQSKSGAALKSWNLVKK